jgi:hypothetical protein
VAMILVSVISLIVEYQPGYGNNRDGKEKEKSKVLVFMMVTFF